MTKSKNVSKMAATPSKNQRSKKSKNEVFEESDSEEECGLCNSSFGENKKLIQCDGPCENWFHNECSNLSPEDYKYISKNSVNSGLKWLCVECDPKLKLPNNKSSNKIAIELLKENKKLNHENKKMAIEIELLKQEKKSSMINSNNIIPIGPSSSAIEDTNKINENKADQPHKMSYSDVLIVKQKANTSKFNVKNLVTSKIDPSKIQAKVGKINQREDGSVEICCEDHESKERLVTSINEQMGDKIDIDINPKYIASKKIEFIVKNNGIRLAENNDELLKEIIRQNDIPNNIENFNVKILRRKSIMKNSAELIIMKLDLNSYNYVMEKRHGRISLHWQSSMVKNHVNVIQCFQCQAYGHHAKECRSRVWCRYCGDNHHSSDCDEYEFKQCVNCCQKNKHHHMKTDTRHYATDRQCPVFISIKEKLENRNK